MGKHVSRCDGLPVRSECNECCDPAVVFCDSCANSYCLAHWNETHAEQLESLDDVDDYDPAC